MRMTLLALGLLLLAIGLQPWQRSWMSRNWPVADGEITRSVLLSPEEREGAWWQRLFHQTRVEYVFTYQKTIYRNGRVEFGLGDQWFVSREFAARIVQRYPVGKPLSVILNPHHPSDAVLESTPSAGGSLLFLVLGTICLAVRYFLGLRAQWNTHP